VKVPDTFAATIAPDVLRALDAALGPPVAERARGTFEVEVEVVGEGTFTLAAKDGVVSAKKGFADDPLLSARLGKGAWPLVRDELQAAVDGFPGNAVLAQRFAAVRQLKRADMEAVVGAVKKLKPCGVDVDVQGAGPMAVARGALDEVVKKMTVKLDAAQIRGILAGASPDTLTATVGGDRGVAADVAAAFGPVLVRLR